MEILLGKPLLIDLPDDNAQMETYDYRIHPPHDDRGETETSNDGNNTKTQEARLLAGTRAPQYSFKLQARNWLFKQELIMIVFQDLEIKLSMG